ncbi:hypothetical protein BDP27DRAFT_1328656 [Rhodocollybia butyracea]|uniref:F-box domain-containing protein n=1 Tax=Rhodocollybia butyracea TaxID=206335 RepID=A0A9P5PTD3_9AGAR|nr:hypothetical protein BDP27DRAFT_1328656 [Rhodocollybia butyracea]
MDMAQTGTTRRLWINSIPHEMLAYIFKWSSCDSSSASDSHTPAIPEILSQVCFLWRELAHSTPALWTELTLNAASTRDSNGKEMLTQWLSRSRRVDIVLRVRKGTDVMETICAHSHLWRRCVISLPWFTLMNFFAMGPLRTPLLEELVVEIQSDSLAGAYPSHLLVNAGRTVLEDCNHLESVRLAILPSFPLESLHSFFPWHNLTEVTFQRPGVHPALIKHVFTHCKSLVRLKIWTAYWRILDFSMHYADDYCLEHLESFELEADVRPLVHMLRSIRLPALKSLSLTGVANDDEEKYPVHPPLSKALMDLQEHSQFDLTTLKLSGLLDFSKSNSLLPDDVLRFVATTPGVTNLVLKCRLGGCVWPF